METVTVISSAAAILLIGLALAVGTVAWLWRALQSAGAGYIARLDSQEAEIDDLRRQIQELRESRIADYALLQEWIGYARRLGGMFRDATGQEPPPEPAAQARPVAQSDMARLARTIAGRFSPDEIEELAFELGLAEHVSGDSASERAASLVRVAQRRGLLARLVALYQRERPNGGF